MKKKSQKIKSKKRAVSKKTGSEKILGPHWSRTLIVKRKGHNESFDERKIYASCFHAIRMADNKRVNAEVICEKIMMEMKKWLKHKKTVSSQQLFKHATKILKKHDKDAAYLYESFRDIN